MRGAKFIDEVKHLKATAHELEEVLGAVFHDNSNVNALIERAHQLIGILWNDSTILFDEKDDQERPEE